MSTTPHLEARSEAHRFTYEYAQPEQYHFCQDSVIFPKFVAEQIKARAIGPEFRTLDVCAGCGVIGLELAHHEPRLQQIDFLEVQPEVFAAPFAENLRRTGRSQERFRFLSENFSCLLAEASREKFDLILGNPPYFSPGEGRLSPSHVQNRCRFFLDADLPTLIRGTAHALKPDGIAFLLLKSGRVHGRATQRDLSLWLAGSAEARVVANIRGTEVIQITKQTSPYSCQR